MRTCNEITELLSAALDGELTDTERRELDDHLASCPACGALLAELRGLNEIVGEPVAAPEGLAGRVMDQIRAEGARGADNVSPLPARRRRYIPWKGWAATAAVAAVVILGVSVLPGRIGPGHTDNSIGAADVPNSTAENSSSVEADSAQTPSMYDGYNTPRAVLDPPPEQVQVSAPGNSDLSVIGLDPQRIPDIPDPAPPTAIFLPPESTAPVIAIGVDAPYCGVLVLTDEPLPEALEVFDAEEDEEGCLTYVVPADTFFMIADELEGKNLSNFSYHDAESEIDPTAAYGLIIVEMPAE